VKVIFYGAGPYLAQNLRRLVKQGYQPVCACDLDATKWHKPFCGRHDLSVLPLEEALAEFPDCNLYATVDTNAMGAVLRYLTAECSIAPERIENWAPIEYRLGCSDLETTVKFRSKRVFARCYWRRPGIDRCGDTAADIRCFDEWRTAIVQAIRSGEPTPCDGCEKLRQGWHLAERRMMSLQMSESDDYSFCNFNCCYCFNKARNRELDSAKLPDADEQLDVLRYVSEVMRHSDLELQFSTGEIMVHPNRDEFIELFKGYRTLLFTNAAIYSERLAALMEQGQLTIMTSLDCGTAETFCHIKSVDCFGRVCDNLVRYAATGGCVILKYIMLPGVNDTETEADGFVALAAKLGAIVQLSNDTRTKRATLPENALRIARRIARQAREKDLLVIHEKDVFSETDNVAISEALRMDTARPSQGRA
jgi:molybdenum cofactor biosynthesis enzyme MoaA